MATLMTPDVFDSSAVAILSALERDGFTVQLARDDGALTIAPRSRLTPERMQAITACKAALTLLLRCRDDGVQARAAEFQRQLAAVPEPRCPAFLFRPDVPYVRGVCFSCGDALPEPRYSRCQRCSLAWRLACRLPVPAALADALDGARRVS